jgi:LDH2 family malate/lactate/ureidoglycolate dehydrogenase
MANSQLVPALEMRRFLTDCLLTAGCDASHANDLVDLLVDADRYGHFSHGLNRIRKNKIGSP